MDDRNGRAPVTLAAYAPIDYVFKEIAETPRTDIIGEPVYRIIIVKVFFISKE